MVAVPVLESKSGSRAFEDASLLDPTHLSTTRGSGPTLKPLRPVSATDRMTRELELPNGETVTPEDVFCYENYPYRVQFPDGESPAAAEGVGEDDYEFVLSPLYWGGGEMDVPFRDREALADQWGPESRGTLAPEEWAAWLREARHDDRFGDDELDALARQLPTPGGDGPLARLRRALGL